MPAASNLGRLVALSQAALAWEALWRVASGVAGMAALFLAVSWIGFWTNIPAFARPVGVILFAAAAVAIAVRGALRTQLSRRDALARIDRGSGDPHGVASTFVDEPANASADSTTAVLWRLHRARMAARLAQVRVAVPSPRALEQDPHALRAGAVLLAIVAAVAAGPERMTRLKAAFIWDGVPALSAATRLDAWIDPPAYTGRPPIVMTDETRGASSGATRNFAAPVGSLVMVRASVASALEASADGGLAPQAPDRTPDEKGKTGDLDRRFVLKGTGRLTLGRTTFEIVALPDLPPKIELLEQPKSNLRGSLTFFYRTDDDYGVVEAEARFATPEIEGRPVYSHPLVEAPRVALALPPDPKGLGEARTTADISGSPWAGARISLTLHARDEGGNEAATAPISIYLPQRNFARPLARALVEQRRNLVLRPEARSRVVVALRALMLEPEKFATGASVYLGLNAAYNRLENARSDDDLRDVAELLWSMALQIEDGGQSDAEREMRAAEQQLHDALQHNASEEDIRRLTDALRSAMEKFLTEMLGRQPDGREQAQQSRGANSRTVTPDDLRKMLDQLEDMARSGDAASARDLLDRLQNMLENLRTAQRRGPAGQAGQEMSRALGAMDGLMRDQQQLRDDTYRDGRRSKERHGETPRSDESSGAPGKSPRRGVAGGDQGPNLRDRQSLLRNRLAEIERRLGRFGIGDPRDLKNADEAMKEADGELGAGGDRDRAVDAQGRALDALRKGAERLARQMQNDGQSSDETEGDQQSDEPGESGAGESDPLGRPAGRSPRANAHARYDPLGASPALRAQRVLEELRRRLGDMTRPQEELDYLDRLIRRY